MKTINQKAQFKLIIYFITIYLYICNTYKQKQGVDQVWYKRKRETKRDGAGRTGEID